MSLRATQWIEVRRRGDVGGIVYVAHPVPGGFRYAEKTCDRGFPVWVTVTVEEFWQEFEKFHA